MKKPFVVLSILYLATLTIPINLSAQTGFRPGYIVTQSLDTLRGYIGDDEDFSLAQRVQFKLATATKTTMYTPDQITSFSLNSGQTFHAFEPQLPNKYKVQSLKVFLELLEDGPLKLYYLHSNGSGFGFFIQKGTGPLQTLYRVAKTQGATEVERKIVDTILNNATQLPQGDYIFTNNYAQTLLREITDIPNSIKLKPDDLSLKSLRSCVRRYNHAKTGTKSKSTRMKESSLYLGAGVVHAITKDGPYKFVKLTPEIDYDFLRGVQLNIGYSNPRISKSLIADLSVKFISNTSEGVRTVSIYKPEYKMDTKGTLVELSCRYHFYTTKKLSPYLHLGVSGGRVKHQYIEEDRALFYKYEFDREFPEAILWGGLGVQFYVLQKHLLYVAAGSSFGAEFGSLPILTMGYSYKLRLNKA